MSPVELRFYFCFSGNGHIIRKFVTISSADFKFGVHLSFMDGNQVG